MVSCVITALYIPSTFLHVPRGWGGSLPVGGCLHTECLQTVRVPWSGLGRNELAPTPQHVSLFLVLNPLLW